jgi:hypothetical protein
VCSGVSSHLARGELERFSTTDTDRER